MVVQGGATHAGSDLAFDEASSPNSPPNNSRDAVAVQLINEITRAGPGWEVWSTN